jgi:type I restriction enzyme S subunit
VSWPEIALGVVCNVRRGTTITQTQSREGNIPVVAGGLNATYYHDTSNRPGNVITISASGANAGYVNFWRSPIFASDCSTVESDGNKVEIKFVYYFLRSKQEYINSKLRAGAAQPHVYAKDIAQLLLPLPPLPEQRSIAAILDQADSLRAKRREALAQLDSLTQAIFIEMFGDPVTNPNNWQSVQLADVSDIVTGFAFKSEQYVDGGYASIKLCRGANVLPGRMDWSDLASWPVSKTEQVAAFKLQAGDIVMAMDRPWISEGFKVAQITEMDCPSLLVQRVARVRGSGNVTNDYLYHLLNHPAFTAHCRPTETTIPHISPREIRSFRFHLPPESLQRDFVKRVFCLNHFKSRQVESLKELDSLFASLQHRAFQGDL